MKVTIAGGGLVGSLCAFMLGERGHDVDVFELRQDPLSTEVNLTPGKSVGLALSARGRASLAILGLEELVLSHSIPMKGRMLHNSDGTTKEMIYDLVGNQCLYSVGRAFLNKLLIKEATKCDNIKFHYNHKIINADLEEGKLLMKTGDKEYSVQADLVIGTDGAHSAVRKTIIRKPGTNFSQKYIDQGYIDVTIPPAANGLHAMAKNYLHIWPRSEFMLIALPNLDGSFTGTLFFPFEAFKKLDTADKVEEFFETYFPDLIALTGMKLLVQTILNNKLSHLLSIECFPFHCGKGVLLGDAAHAMVPFYGQGMNAGFEDVLILDNILTNPEFQTVEECLAQFTQDRSKDAVAICELAMEHYLEMRHLVNQRSFCLRRVLDSCLFRIFGNDWIPMYHAVTFSRLPYSKCISHRKWQDEVLKIGRRCVALSLSCVVVGFGIYWRNAKGIHSSESECISTSAM